MKKHYWDRYDIWYTKNPDTKDAYHVQAGWFNFDEAVDFALQHGFEYVTHVYSDDIFGEYHKELVRLY